MKRYNQGFGKFGPMEQCKDGEWVRYEDHIQRVIGLSESAAEAEYKAFRHGVSLNEDACRERQKQLIKSILASVICCVVVAYIAFRFGYVFAG